MQRLTDGVLVPILQTAIGPVILISGVGLLLLTMTNRLSRTIDRAREISDSGPESSHLFASQLRILWSRARIQQLSILFASTSALLSAVLIIALFIAGLGKVEMSIPISLLFVGSMLSIIVSLALFIKDINNSLRALQLELRPHGMEGT